MSRSCTVEGCAEKLLAKGMCRRHYMAARSTRPRPACDATGCDRPQFCKKLCRGHYARLLRGRPLLSPLREMLPGNVIISCRICEALMERLSSDATILGTTPNKLVTRLLMAHYGLRHSA